MAKLTVTTAKVTRGALATSSVLLTAILSLGALSHHTTTGPRLTRITSMLEAKAARWRGHPPKPVALSGRLTGTGALIDALKGARIAAVESTSGYAASADQEGRFTLPHLLWFPHATYTLLITSNVYDVRRISLRAPQAFPENGVIDVGELPVHEAVKIPFKNSLLRYLEYDPANSNYYATLFTRLTRNACTHHDKIQSINRYVASRHNPDEIPWSFKSARQALDLGAPHCSDLAFAMAAITAAGGYPTRTVHTSDTDRYSRTHVVVEVYYDESWHLYDPTYAVFFRNKSGSVASYRDLRLDPRLITDEAIQGINEDEARAAQEWMAASYASGLHQIYYVDEQAFVNSRACQN